MAQACVLTRKHRPKRLSTEDMHVQMRHFLPAIAADIGEQAIARFDQTGFPRDMADRPHEAGYRGIRRPAGEIVPGYVGAFGDHQDMVWRLRIDVVEGERMLVLIDLGAGYLAAK